MMLLLLACQRTTPVADGDALPFPHPAGFEEAHGEAVARYGESCASCHRDDVGAPTCESCHEGYPHAEGWLDGAVHGPAAAASCEGCHGAESTVTPACTGCHGSYPHAEGWAEAGQHGAWVIARGSAEASCGGCHDPALTALPQTPACDSCHDSYPHEGDWLKAHRLADTATCTGCHGVTGEGGLSGISCARCHPGYPHAEDWTAGHIAPATLRGEATCMGCHESGDGPEQMPASCGASCHGGKP